MFHLLGNSLPVLLEDFFCSGALGEVSKGSNGALLQSKVLRKAISSVNYFDVVAAGIAVVLAVRCFFIAAGQNWPWKRTDLLGIALFLLTSTPFILFRRQAYTQRIRWLFAGFAVSMFATMVILLRNWSVLWVVGGSALLLFALVIRSRSLSEGICREDIFRVILIVGSILFVLPLLEVTLRLFPALLTEDARLRVHWQGNGKPWQVSHPYIGHLHITDAVARAATARPGVESDIIDRWGFRNPWPWPERAEIVAVGDSLTYGQTVNDDQAWTTIVDRALPRSRALNLGLIGAAPQQYLRVYETFGVNMSPKVLLVGLFLGNDLHGAEYFDLWWRSGGTGSFMEFGRKKAELWRWMMKSYLFAMLQSLHDSYKSGRFLQGRTMQLADGSRVQLVPGELWKMSRLGQPGRPAMGLILKTLEDIQALGKQHHTHLMVLFFPMKEEVYLPLLGEEMPDLAAPFIPELVRRGISYVDLGPYFRERAATGETLFWEVDGHPNSRGYALIAEVVLSHLKRNAKSYGLRDWQADPNERNEEVR